MRTIDRNLEPVPFQLLDVGEPFLFSEDWDSAYHKTGPATYTNGTIAFGIIKDPAEKMVLRLVGRYVEPSSF